MLLVQIDKLCWHEVSMNSLLWDIFSIFSSSHADFIYIEVFMYVLHRLSQKISVLRSEKSRKSPKNCHHFQQMRIKGKKQLHRDDTARHSAHDIQSI